MCRRDFEDIVQTCNERPTYQTAFDIPFMEQISDFDSGPCFRCILDADVISGGE